MTPEPPPGYVAFVESHLLELRREAVRIAGDEDRAAGLYPQALTDVAVRWDWFELLRTRLNRPDMAAEYLHQALLRRSVRSESDQDWPVEIEVWRSDDPRASPYSMPARPQHGRPDPNGPLHEPPPEPDAPAAAARPPDRSSAALRLLSTFDGGLRVEATHIAEASIAWWHAYEAQRRFLLIGVCTVFLLMLAALVSVAGR
jgi:hypothetical protein